MCFPSGAPKSHFVKSHSQQENSEQVNEPKKWYCLFEKGYCCNSLFYLQCNTAKTRMKSEKKWQRFVGSQHTMFRKYPLPYQWVQLRKSQCLAMHRLLHTDRLLSTNPLLHTDHLQPMKLRWLMDLLHMALLLLIILPLRLWVHDLPIRFCDDHLYHCRLDLSLVRSVVPLCRSFLERKRWLANVVMY